MGRISIWQPVIYGKRKDGSPAIYNAAEVFESKTAALAFLSSWKESVKEEIIEEETEYRVKELELHRK